MPGRLWTQCQDGQPRSDYGGGQLLRAALEENFGCTPAPRALPACCRLREPCTALLFSTGLSPCADFVPIPLTVGREIP